MDLNQRKLNKSEWNSIEVPVSQAEIDVLNLIKKGFHDINIRVNNHNSIFTFLKIEYSEKMEDYLYNKYLREIIENMLKKYGATMKISVNVEVKLKSSDKIRMERTCDKDLKCNDIYEFILLTHLENILKFNYEKGVLLTKNKLADISHIDKKFAFHYYTLFKLLKNNVQKINRHVLEICNKFIGEFESQIDMTIIIENAVELIEKNANLLKYTDMSLYTHQKEIFSICKIPNPKLILYIAPTGTGKTMTPIALSENYKIIFVCAARHVGLALARAAISVNKKIAFAFGCASADDIRLHYFAASEYTKNKRSGGIGKVDNSVGNLVEIMICDIKSYLPAMYYMKSFNSSENLIVYWDEPTITLDYPEHDFHSIIKKNWTENLIPNMVLSSATLPKLHELTETTSDFKDKFESAEVFNIVSHDCKKSIPILNKDGYVILPHYLNKEYDKMITLSDYCENNLTLSRYFDLKEIVEFIAFVNKNNYSLSKGKLERYFDNLDDVTMQNIKIYYIALLKNLGRDNWEIIYDHFIKSRTSRIPANNAVDTKGNRIMKVRSIGPGVSLEKSTTMGALKQGQPLCRIASEQIVPSVVIVPTPLAPSVNPGIYVTTKDAFTLTDGPTIFLSNDIEKIAKFCIQQANIPGKVMEDLLEKIQFNNALNEKIHTLEQELEFITEQMEKSVESSSGSSRKSSKDCRKFNRDVPDEMGNKNKLSKATNDISALRSMIKGTSLNDVFVPNKTLHLSKWAEGLENKNVFTSDIDDQVVNEIMLLHGVADSWKVLLMMGIGVFTNHENITYTEIMKKMADQQKLYMIIASSDYIYGTNYQFCHAYLSKDLNLTQEKIIQAMGRVGRNNIQQDYTLRFRDDEQILKLFTEETDKPEIINMNKLFNCANVEWNGENYVVIADDTTSDEA